MYLLQELLFFMTEVLTNRDHKIQLQLQKSISITKFNNTKNYPKNKISKTNIKMLFWKFIVFQLAIAFEILLSHNLHIHLFDLFIRQKRWCSK